MAQLVQSKSATHIGNIKMDEYRIFHTGRSENVGLVLALSEDQLNGNAARSALRHHMGASEEKLFAAKIINTVLLELKTDKHGRIEALRLEVPGQIEGFGRYNSCSTLLTEIGNFDGLTGKLIDEDNSSIFYVKRKTGKTKADASLQLDQLTDNLLDRFLFLARPVARYRSSFFVPLRDKQSDGSNIGDAVNGLLRAINIINDKSAYARLRQLCRQGKNWHFLPPESRELHYFSRDIRGALGAQKFNGSKGHQGALESFQYQLDKDNANRISLNKDTQIWISGIKMHFSCENIIFLEVECAHTAIGANQPDMFENEIDAAFANTQPNKCQNENIYKENKDRLLKILGHETSNKCLWRYYMSGSATNRQCLSLAQAMQLNNLVRFTKLTFQHNLERVFELETQSIENGEFQQFNDNNDLPSNPNTFGNNFESLIKQVFNLNLNGQAQSSLDCLGLEKLGDDRALVISSIIMDGRPFEAGGKTDAVFSRIGMVDGPGTSHAYDDQISMSDLTSFAYRRYWDLGSHYLISAHSFVFCGFRNHSVAVENMLAFSEELVHQNHMRTIYRRMALYAYFLRFKLLAIAQDIRMAHGQMEKNSEALSKVRSEFLRFHSYTWTLHPTTQLQGMELFDRLAGKLRLSERLEEVEKRIGKLEEFKTSKAFIADEWRRSLLYYLGLPLVMFLALMPTTELDSIRNAILELIKNLLPYSSELSLLHPNAPAWISGAIIVILAALVTAFSVYILRLSGVAGIRSSGKFLLYTGALIASAAFIKNVFF